MIINSKLYGCNRFFGLMNKVAINFVVCAVMANASLCMAVEADSIQTIGLQNVDVISSIKENGLLRQQPSSVTLMNSMQLETKHITSLKNASQAVPNLYMPDYGSRLTSAIYIRGIGSRINMPAVGLYVDNIPYVDKSAFDFNFYDIERIDIMRGPQGTLYGRNTMGGVVKVYTKSPFQHEGTDVKVGFATGDNHRNVSLTHYHRPSNKFAFAAGGYYEGADGFFKHDITGKKVDEMQSGGGRLHAIYLPTSFLSFDFAANYDYSDEGGYPYFHDGKITNNEENRYYRSLFNTGLNIEYKKNDWQFNSVTGFQHLRDRMFLDQDFIQDDIYTMLQKQRINTVTEEITLKKRIKISSNASWHPLIGVSGFYQSLHTKAPVTFKNDGIKSLIEDNINSIFTGVKAQNPKMPTMALSLNDREFTSDNNIKTPLRSFALFHNSIFNIGKWNFTLGIRWQIEHMKIDFNSGTQFDYTFGIPDFHINYPLTLGLVASEKMKDHYSDFLPKFAVQYNFDSNNQVYASASRGSRSGGYNIQMVSDLMQPMMKNQMINDVNEVSKGMMAKFVDIESITGNADATGLTFKPEYSWTYEAGTHLRQCEGKLNVDAALFYTKVTDQQIARFADSGLGRKMVNAGESEMLGGELSVKYLFSKHFVLNGSYGYTHAKFVKYEEGQNTAYNGNYVPFVPKHTVSADAAYTWFIGSKTLTAGVNWNGTGDIYWTEANNSKQKFYGVLNAYLNAQLSKAVTVNLWGKNLTQTKYNTFYFESVGRAYEQHSKPLQIGIDLNVHF